MLPAAIFDASARPLPSLTALRSLDTIKVRFSIEELTPTRVSLIVFFLPGAGIPVGQPGVDTRPHVGCHTQKRICWNNVGAGLITPVIIDIALSLVSTLRPLPSMCTSPPLPYGITTNVT